MLHVYNDETHQIAILNKRLHYIDWLRVLAFATLILFHCAVPFVEHYTWEINNVETSPWITRIVWWTHQWRLPLLFFIAGVGVRFSLRKRSVLAFMGERTIRLFIPLVFAIFFITPIQVYFEWMQKGRIQLSYPEFYPRVFEIVPYPEGAFTWSHMWFVAYLFVFTILLLPVFSMSKLKFPDHYRRWFESRLSSPLLAISLSAPFILYFFRLFIEWPEQGSLINDWFVFTSSITYYFLGYFLSGLESFWETCLKYRKLFLGIALSLSAILFFTYFWDWNANRPVEQGPELYLFGFMNSLHIWTVILSAIGYSMRYLNRPGKHLTYLNTAIYPFYIMHQAVIVASGYYLLPLEMPIFLKLLLLVIICITVIWSMYHFVVRKTMITRVLFGMKAKRTF
ncbi:acyltransferase family protein [Robertkochia sediminum]|uniref:acyltransferase family protein n=1 Tax=Robertkochia sediminum TaxID=2785326 RepID=UPI00193425A5|nr:acyltransferase family protein [Robertkochia sediminum]MBL7473858.1 acyltransferase family protein [Robertkochia sediminum]